MVRLLSLHQLKKPLDVTRDLKTFKLKRCACCIRVTRENLNACKAFVDFWEDHVIIPSVRVFYRHPSLQKKPLMVMYLMSDDFNVFKIHIYMMMMLMNMARKFGVMVEHQNSLFVLRNPRLQALSVWP